MPYGVRVAQRDQAAYTVYLKGGSSMGSKTPPVRRWRVDDF